MKPAIEMFGVFIPSYFLVISALSCLVPFWILIMAKYLDLSLSSEQLLADCGKLLVLGLIGGRAFHVLYEAPAYYLDHPIQIVQFWKGGFVVFGGLLTALIWILFRKPSNNELDVYAMTYSPMYALGRVGCWLEGCCGIQGSYQWVYLVLELSLWAFLLWGRNKLKSTQYTLAMAWLFGHALTRFIIEFYRTDERGPEWILSISQWIALGFVAIATPPIWNRLFNISKKNRASS